MNINNFLSDTWQITKRNLIHYKRSPRLIFFSAIQPIIFVLLFAYVFGGAIDVPGNSYINFLIPAIIIQTVLFGAVNTAVGLAEDMTKGIIDRFRTLPMSRSAVIAGRTMADSLRNIFTVLIMIGVGYAIGFRIEQSLPEALGAIALAVLFGFAIMWIMIIVGLSVKKSETAQMAGMVFVFPLTFASSAFVPTASMPDGLQWFAEHSPVTYAIDTLRGLMITGNYNDTIWYMVVWIVAISIIAFPLAVRQYKKIN